MKSFKIRASQLSKIMTKPKDSGGITDTQQEFLNDMDERDKPMTEKQQEKYDYLLEKKHKPEGLSEGAKTYCKEWLKHKLLGREPEIASKYLDKGIIAESGAIQLLNKLYQEDYTKNTERLSNEFMTGECDIHKNRIIRDTKCSWSVKSFPMLAVDVCYEYYWQNQAYLILWDAEYGWVDYCLVNTPDRIIEQESKRISWRDNRDYIEVLEEQEKKHKYDDLEVWKRVKSFPVERHDVEERINQKVILCREHIETLIKENRISV